MQLIRVRRLTIKDLSLFTGLVQLFNDVFEVYHSCGSEEQLRRLLSSSQFIAYVIEKDGDLIGGLTAYELKRYYSDKSELYIYDVAILEKHQNQGFGKKLMQEFIQMAKEVGIESVFVQAHSEDLPAVKFYNSLQAQTEKVDLFTFDLH